MAIPKPKAIGWDEDRVGRELAGAASSLGRTRDLWAVEVARRLVISQLCVGQDLLHGSGDLVR